MNSLFIALLLLISWFVPSEGALPQPFKPIWHQPNDYDINGQSCANKKPTVQKTCPLFGVVSQGLTQEQFQSVCAGFGFHCDGHILLDGNCERCEDGYELVQEDGDVFCRNPAGDVQYKGKKNPFDCTDENFISRSNRGSYRPCHSVEASPLIDVPHYYIGDDFALELTMASCAAERGISDYKTTVNQIRGEETYDFPVVRCSDGTDTPFGYLMCPNVVPEPYNYASSGWLALYGVYGFGFFLFICFYFYKMLRESKLEKRGKNINTSSHSIDFDETNLLQRITQDGYKNDLFGRIAFYYLIGLTILLKLFMLVAIFDTYGVNLFLFCRGDKDLVAACEESINSGIDPSWREGYTCASGCLFSWNFSNGEFAHWPYAPKLGGGENIYIVFISIWNITVAWFIALRFIQQKIGAFFRIKVPLNEADIVKCSKRLEEPIQIEKEKNSFVQRIIEYMDSIYVYILGEKTFTAICHVQMYTDLHIKYIDFQNSRFIYNKEHCRFLQSSIPYETSYREYITQTKEGIESKQVLYNQKLVGKNHITVKVPNLFLAIFDEFFNYFYFYQIFCCWILVFFIYWTMGVVILVMVVGSGLIRVFTRLSSLKYIKNIASNETTVDVFRDGQWVKISSHELVPGDVIKLHPKMFLPADIVLTQGRCVMDESSLTGEPTPVPKVPIENENVLFDKSEHNQKHTLLAGTYTQSCTSNKETEDVLGVVFSTGIKTSKGSLIRDILYPPPLNFKFDNHWNVAFVILLCWGIVVFIFNYFIVNGLIASWFYGMIIISQIISPLIPAVFVVAATKGALRIKKNGVYCSNPHRLYAAGKIKLFCFDKTGTLTHPGMLFKGVCYIKDSKIQPNKSKDLPELIHLQLGCCHELDFINSSGDNKTHTLDIIGNILDTEMFKNSSCEIDQTGTQPIIRYKNKSFKILKRFEFDRRKLTMSTIVEDLDTGKHFVLTKGSTEALTRVANNDSIPQEFQKFSEDLSRQGYYTLGLAWKPYVASKEISLLTREEVECNLELTGLLTFQNDIKGDAYTLVQELKEGHIRPIMVTGDNAMTAIKVARDIALSTSKHIFLGDWNEKTHTVVWKNYDTDETITDLHTHIEGLEQAEIELVLNSRAFEYYFEDPSQTDESRLFLKFLLRYTRIFSRMKPAQKVKVVENFMEIGITGMCGDGANDAGALRTAHCGIALSNASSDISIVAPFCSSSTNLSIITDVVREGRCLLATALASYKALIMYGQILVASSLITFYFGVVCTEFFWITWDSFINVGMAWCILQTKPAKKLSPNRPSSKLLGLETFLSLIFQITFNWTTLLILIIYLFNQDWFLCKEFDANLIDQALWYLKGANYEGAIIAIATSFQFASTFPVNNYGFEYRRKWINNIYLSIYFLFWLIFYSFLLLFDTNYLNCLFLINCGDKSLVENWDGREVWEGQGEFIGSYPSTMPPGCPCTQQVIESEFCEAEYVNCEQSHYNQTYHHNIIPFTSRYIIMGIIITNLVCLFLCEGVFIVGPVRRLCRKYLSKKKDKSVIFDQNNTRNTHTLNLM